MWYCIKKDGGIILLVFLDEFDDEFLELLYIF